jgi:hypothetical protein
LAIDVYKNRKEYAEISTNPMKTTDLSELGTEDE